VANAVFGGWQVNGILTVQGGLRWDRQQGKLSPNSVDASPLLGTPLTLNCINTLTCNGTSGGKLDALLPALTFAGDDKSLKWNSVSPRIGEATAGDTTPRVGHRHPDPRS